MSASPHLTHCPECNGDVSNTDTVCPHCSYRLPASASDSTTPAESGQAQQPLLTTRLFQPIWLMLIFGGFAMVIADMLPLGGTGTTIPGIVLAATGIALFIYSQLNHRTPHA